MREDGSYPPPLSSASGKRNGSVVMGVYRSSCVPNYAYSRTLLKATLSWRNHSLHLSALVDSGEDESFSVVLGHPWLRLHNPSLEWASGKISAWSIHCLLNCLRSASAPVAVAPQSVPEPPDLTLVPLDYHDLGPVFSKQHALSLPPHRPYDCVIDLLPGSPLPSRPPV